MFHIGTDVGGTFTDCVIMDETGKLAIGKRPSTPPDFYLGAIESIRAAASELGLTLEEVLRRAALLVHGSTVATNALITRSGAKAGLLTTRGFEDTIFIMRAKGRHDGLPEGEIKRQVRTENPSPIIPRHLVKGVVERVDCNGDIIVPLDKDRLRRAVKELIREGVEAIAVCLLWSFRNPAHEQEIARLIKQEHPDLFVSVSSDLACLIGEYERTATTAINAYLGPITSRYVKELDAVVRGKGSGTPLYIMQCHGGVLPVQSAAESPVSMLGSGPVGGLIGSKYLADILGFKNVICTDVGGTSFDVSLIHNGAVERATEAVEGQYSLRIPMLNIVSIGAGGGSLAWLEPITKVLKVGPKSAGARPGPVCYDTGGTEPTVTDADLVLGYLNPEYFLGGRMKLNVQKATEAIEKIGIPLGLSTIEAAVGIRRIVDAHMLDLVRSVTVARGYDPRECALLAFGGNGPLHAIYYGKETRAIVVPGTASIHSAFGVLASNVKRVYQVSDIMGFPFDAKRFTKRFQELSNRAVNELHGDGFKDGEIIIDYSVDVRYKRQVHELETPVPVKDYFDEGDMSTVLDTFEPLYESLYGKGAAYREAGAEIVTFRVIGQGVIPIPALAKRKKGRTKPPPSASKGSRQAFSLDSNVFTGFAIYELSKLEPANVVAGPAIIETPVTTILIDANYEGKVDEYLDVIIERRVS